METEFLMEVAYIFKNGEKGKRIVGGADSKYPTNDISWLNFTNRNVMIMIKEEEFIFKVKKVDVFPSISGALNINSSSFIIIITFLLILGIKYIRFRRWSKKRFARLCRAMSSEVMRFPA